MICAPMNNLNEAKMNDVKSRKHVINMMSFEKNSMLRHVEREIIWIKNKIFATYRFCSQRIIVMLRAENLCPVVFFTLFVTRENESKGY